MCSCLMRTRRYLAAGALVVHFGQLVPLVPRSWKCAHAMDSLLEGEQLCLQSRGREMCNDLYVEPQVGDTFHVSGVCYQKRVRT